MRRFLNWINDKKSKTLRKWRSSVVTGPNANIDETEGFLVNDYSDYHHLRPIGGSESALSKPSSDQLPRRKTSNSKGKLKAQRSASALGRSEGVQLDMVNEEFDDLDVGFS
uniref:Movement protein n=1 Tax=Panagrellus redivivus TaxID=6233 RepID=A0A7E4UTJ5_PANRE